jgi:hypothetical protein
MMGRLKTLGSALLVAAVLVMGIDYVSFAATGQALILGNVNHAGSVTTLDRRTNGPALKLKTNNNAAAPFVTNGLGKVAHLNADKVDGKSASAFAPAARAPIAAGFINENGSLGRSWGVASSTWDAGNLRYAITLQGVDFLFSRYAVNVTPICDTHEVRYSSFSDDLLVIVTNNSATRVQCAFAFTVFKLPA